MKKIITMMLLAVSLIFIGSQDNQAEAAHVFVGYYQDNGDAAYLITESLAGGKSRFSCDVVTNRGDYVHYNFFIRGGDPYYTTSWYTEGYVYTNASPVAVGIWEYVQRH